MSCAASARRSGDVAIIDLTGRVMHAEGAEALRDAIRREVEQGCKKILLNLDGVDYIDSSGIGALASSYITLEKLGGRMKLLNTQSRISSMLHVTNLYRVFVTFTDEREALASFA